MNRPAHSRRTKAQWQQLVNEHASSDLSIKAFCAQNHIPYVSFSNWRRRLSKNDTHPSLIDLSALMDKPNLPGWLIELDLGNGIKLNLKQN